MSTLQGQGGLPVVSSDFFSEQDPEGPRQTAQGPAHVGDFTGNLTRVFAPGHLGYLHLLPNKR